MKLERLILSALLLTAACTSIEQAGGIKDPVLVPTYLSTGPEADGTRAQMNGRTSIYWSPSDSILVHDGSGSRLFVSTNTAPAQSTTFKGMAAEDASSFAALYPASADNNITRQGNFATFTVTVPALQTAVEGSFDPRAHIAYACSGSDGMLHFHNLSAMLRFTAPEGSWTSVSIKGASGEIIAGKGSVTIGIDTGCADGSSGSSGYSTQQGTDEIILSGDIKGGCEYIAVLAPAELENGIVFNFTSSNGSSLCARLSKAASLTSGRILNAGTPEVLKPGSYTIYNESQLASLSSALSSMGISSEYTFTISMISMLFLKNTTQPLQAVDYTYTSTGPFGEPETLSARLYVRKSVWDGDGELEGIALACHGTVMGAHEGPTETTELHGLLGWADYAVVEPDYWGFGVTSSKMQAYLQKECTAKQCLDALVAAKKILADKKVAYGGKCFNLGYSQGGHAAIGNLWYLASKGGYEGIKFTKTIAGAGPYDLNATYKWMMGLSSCAGAFSIPLCVISMNEYGRLGLDYSKIFRGALLNNYQNWVMSGSYTLYQLQTMISRDPSNLLVQGILDGSSEEALAISGEFSRNSLVSGWDPSACGPIVLFHSTQDDIVPSFNSDTLCEFLKAAGADVNLTKNESGTHANAVFSYALTMLQNMN